MDRSFVFLLLLSINEARSHLRARQALPTATDCYDDQGSGYRGQVSSTMSGRTCKMWTDTELTIERDNGLGHHNFCRNPDGSRDQPWCYTVDPNTKYDSEVCNVPKCPTQQRDFTAEAAAVAMEMESKNCDCMDQLYGSSRTTADTAVPLVLAAEETHGTKVIERCHC
eukprot:TRINITY_DN7728_c0_g1_i1.p1 TRINITY_DN7728_c0_g1~~TRINITY_DN7728_c0_g1_i1.p1  ORF type:complete len:187 (-),score=14.45 TRINITY_DN7728_c0_g1_i1:405-908(-)